jgi:ATP-dependent helicase HrpA
MKALATRLERLAANPAKDRDHTETLAELTEPLSQWLLQHPQALESSPPLAEYRWMLEELRVSFFAQSLGTAQPVSVKRLGQQWAEVERWTRESPDRAPGQKV